MNPATATMTDHDSDLKAPFPWFGGKRKVAPMVWDRFGNVATYNEPFAGSLAVLLGRPHEPRVETVNDLDCYLANFWRALQHDPEAVAYYADSPVNEADLHARHRWLVQSARERAERVMTEPDFYDAKIAGWWVWGACLWIGSGWCQKPEWTGRANAGRRARGINAQRVASTRSGESPWLQAKRPHLSDAGGKGVHRKRPQGAWASSGIISERRWQGGGAGGGSGVHAPSLTRQKPELRGDSGATGSGVVALARAEGLYDYMHQLAARLRRVRVCCGDWTRVLTPSVTTYVGVCGVFLDPPYDHDLRERCYAEDHNVSGAVREWAIANGDNPEFRIALCGYEGEHAMPSSWECVPWKAHGGYSRTERGVANRSRERVWFSPHCLQPGLFAIAQEHTA